MTLRNANPPVAQFRSAVARLHPGSTIRFVLDTGEELEVVATEKSQAHRTSDKGNDVPTAAPSMTVILRRPTPTLTAEQWIKQHTGLENKGKTLDMREKPPPNSGDLS